MVIWSSVTPWSVAPLASPGPHGDGSVPKWSVAAPSACVVPDREPSSPVAEGLLPRSELHEAATTSATAKPLPMRRDQLLPTDLPLVSRSAPGHPSRNLTDRHK